MTSIRLLLVSILSLSIFCFTVFSHSGGTDSKGGHRNSATGEYHYHHGHSAHQHDDIDGDGEEECLYVVEQTVCAFSGIISVALLLIVPKLWRAGKKRRSECISKGNVYYGLLYYRIALIYAAAASSIALIYSYSTRYLFIDTHTIFISIVFAIPLSIFYINLYNKLFTKAHLCPPNKKDGH